MVTEAQQRQKYIKMQKDISKRKKNYQLKKYSVELLEYVDIFSHMWKSQLENRTHQIPNAKSIQ